MLCLKLRRHYTFSANSAALALLIHHLYITLPQLYKQKPVQRRIKALITRKFYNGALLKTLQMAIWRAQLSRQWKLSVRHNVPLSYRLRRYFMCGDSRAFIRPKGGFHPRVSPWISLSDQSRSSPLGRRRKRLVSAALAAELPPG